MDRNKFAINFARSVFFLFIMLCLTTQLQLERTIALTAKAPNYGDIRFELTDNEGALVEGNFIINSNNKAYLSTLPRKYKEDSLVLKLDGRHEYFSSYGILLFNHLFEAYWISASDFINRATHHNIGKIKKSGIKAKIRGLNSDSFLIFKPEQLNKQRVYAPFYLLIIALIMVLSSRLLASAFNCLNIKFSLKVILYLLCFTLICLSNYLFIIQLFLFYWLTFFFVETNQGLKPLLQKLKSRDYYLMFIFCGLLINVFASQYKVFQNMYFDFKNDKVPLNTDILGKIGDYYEKNVQFKQYIGHINSIIKIEKFKYSPTAKVIIGKSGMMFEGTGERRVEGDTIISLDNVSDYLGRLPFTDQQLSQWQTTIEQRRCWLKSQGIEYLFAIAPTKALVYPELLPEQIIRVKSKAKGQDRITSLENYLRKNGQDVINLTHKLIAHKNQNERLFYRTDFHWNYLGAFYAYQAIAKKINKKHPDLGFDPLTLRQFKIIKNNYWAHSRFLGLLGLDHLRYRNDTYFKMMPTADNPLSHIPPYNKEGVYDIRIPRKEIIGIDEKKYSAEYIYNPKGKNQKIMIIGDSFIQKAIPYFSVHAKDSYFSRAVFHFPVQLIKKLKPKIVIQEILNMYLLKLPPKNTGEVAKAKCA